ncbi:helix-hairpin-helix domain-containing protein [Candidatus Hodarchaeum mangrovi]
MAVFPNSDEIKLEIINSIAFDLKITINQVENTLVLLEEGNTVPFIARYRKEMTNSLDEVQIRSIDQIYKEKNLLEHEKQRIIENIRSQGKLTEGLEKSIDSAESMGELNEIYKPYKQKKKTRGQIARELGLEPLADKIQYQKGLEGYTLESIAKDFVNVENKLESIETCLSGARDIIAEDLSLSIEIRDLIKEKFYPVASFKTQQSILYQLEVEENPNSPKVIEGKKYEQYFDYEENALLTPPHRLLAMIRGDREGILSFKINFPDSMIISNIIEMTIPPQEILEGANKQLTLAIEDSWKRLLGPSMARELKRTQLEKAELHSVKVFAENLKHLLLTPPVKDRKILGIDPAYRTGCKLAIIDEIGSLIETGTIYPHQPQQEWNKSKEILRELVTRHNLSIIAIGNGTASRETENLISELAKEIDLKYIIVNEAGASVYSASDVAREEFPNLDVSIRGAVSIARRLQDPLAELVKIDPKSIGVGQYQHDLSGLSLALNDVVIDTVNLVGVDVNTASESLLRFVSGITRSIAKNIVNFRDANGAFIYREELKKVNGIGPRTFEQAAGFLRILGSPEPFDNSPIHPESYQLAEELLKVAKATKEDLVTKVTREKLQKKLKLLNPEWIAKQLMKEEKLETIKDIIQILQNPFLDPREEFEKPLLKSEVLAIDDLVKGMSIEGTITNVVDFGVFVDIGVKINGLIHISEMSNSKFIRHPRDADLHVGNIVKARVLDIDIPRKRISLSLKNPELKPEEGEKLDKQIKSSYIKKKKMTIEEKKFATLMKNGKIQL